MIAYAKRGSDLVLLGKSDHFDYDKITQDKGYEAIWELRDDCNSIAIIEMVIHAGLKGVDYWRLDSILDGYGVQKEGFMLYIDKTLRIKINESNNQFIATITNPDKRWVAQGEGLVRTTIQVLRKFERETRQNFRPGMLGC